MARLSRTQLLSLRDGVGELTNEAAADLQVVWRSVEKAVDAGEALNDILPALVDQYGVAAAAMAAQWYDSLRDKAEVAGSFRSDPIDIKDSGTGALIGWALSEATDYPTFQTLILGGTQRRIANFARSTVTTASVADPGAHGWQRVGTGECDFCEMLLGRGAVFSEATADFAAHDHCFPAGVLVTGPSAEIGYRRWYEGELVVIGMADGQELPVTPNHPILTPRGWVLAGELREGDDLVVRAGADLASLDVPHEQDVPTPIEDVWRAASMNRLRSVPVTAKDFHGDTGLRQSNVDVVATDRLLANVRDVIGVQHRAQNIGARTRAPAVLDAFASSSDLLLDLIGNDLPSASGMGGRGELFAFRCRHSTHTQHSGFRGRSNRQSRISEPTLYYTASNVVPLGHGEHALSAGVDSLEISRRGNPVVPRHDGVSRPRFDAPALERMTNAVSALATERGRDLIERLAGGVKPLRIVDLVRRESAGHVYNLQTAEGWYSANGVIVSNCKCQAVPAFDGQPKPVKPYTPSVRHSEADQARAREWIANNL